MFLKKINQSLNLSLTESGFTEPNDLQHSSFSLIKSGADTVLVSSPQSGKTTTIALNVIHKLEAPFEQSPRALIIVSRKEKILELTTLFEKLNKHNQLRIYPTYEQTDIDYDKNMISVGIDVLIGTPKRLAELFSGAGFDINRLKLFIVDDIDVILKNRQELIITRLSDSIEKTQRIFTATHINDKIEMLAEKIMINPTFVEME